MGSLCLPFKYWKSNPGILRGVRFCSSSQSQAAIEPSTSDGLTVEVL